MCFYDQMLLALYTCLAPEILVLRHAFALYLIVGSILEKQKQWYSQETSNKFIFHVFLKI